MARGKRSAAVSVSTDAVQTDGGAADFGFDTSIPVSEPAVETQAETPSGVVEVRESKPARASESTDIHSNGDRMKRDAEGYVEPGEKAPVVKDAEAEAKESAAEAKAIVEKALRIAAGEKEPEVIADKGKEKGDEKNAADPEKSKTIDDKKPEGDVIPAMPDDLLAEAVAAGIPVADAKALTPTQLEKAIALKSGKEAKAGESKPKDPEFEPFKLDINPDDFDDEAVKVFDVLTEQINDLRKQTAVILKEREQREGMQVETQRAESLAKFHDEFDNIINALPEGELEIFGKGRGHEIDKESAAYKNRIALLKEIDILSAGYMQTGEKLPTVKELVDKAKKSAFADQLAEIKLAGTRKKLNDRSDLMLLRSSDSQTRQSEGDPRDAAVKAVADKLREFNS